MMIPYEYEYVLPYGFGAELASGVSQASDTVE
jgi:hypothetical protein